MDTVPLAVTDDAAPPANTPVAEVKRKKFITVSLAWLLMAMCLWVLGWFLETLDDSGTYVFFAPGINSSTLAALMTVISVGALVAGVHGLVCCVVDRVRQRWVGLLTKIIGLITALSSAAVLLLFASLNLLGAPSASYVLKSPSDDRSMLVLNHSFLLLGSFHVYESRSWPIYSHADWIGTDNGYDPFRKGQYKETWTDAGLELEYVPSYRSPESFTRISIPLPLQRAFPQGPDLSGR